MNADEKRFLKLLVRQNEDKIAKLEEEMDVDLRDDYSKLNTEEKEILRELTKEHLEQVKRTEKIPNQQFEIFAAEIKYEDFLKGVLKKLS